MHRIQLWHEKYTVKWVLFRKYYIDLIFTDYRTAYALTDSYLIVPF